MNTPVIDAHVHLWDPSQFTYKWLDGSILWRRKDAPDLAAAATSVDQFVVVQADCAPSQGLAEVAWLDQQADLASAIGGIVAFAPIEHGDELAIGLRELLTYPRVVGVRRLLQDEPANFMLTDDFRNGLHVLGEAGLSFDVCVHAGQLSTVAEMVSRSPNTQFVLDHLGKPRIGAGAAEDEAWRKALARLAGRPNIVCKLSGLSTELVGGSFSASRVIPYLRHALEVFGPQRCLFASDWPVLTEATSHQQWFDTVIDALDQCSAEAREQVLAGTARRIYRMTDSPVALQEHSR